MTDNIKFIADYLANQGLDAYIVFTDDDHGSEYPVDYYKARAFLSGFTGSAGTMVITRDDAYVWTDGRYFLQAADQLESTGVKLMKMGEEGVPTIAEFIDGLSAKPRVAFDFKVATVNFVNGLLARVPQVELVDESKNIDKVWLDRPAICASKAYMIPDEDAGMSVANKLSDLQSDISQAKCDYALISSLDDIAWLFNLRGSDVSFSPVNYSFAIIGLSDKTLYIDDRKLDEKIRRMLSENGVVVKPYSTVYADAEKIDGKTLIDAGKTNYALYVALKDKKVADVFPTTRRKSIKNIAEIRNMRAAHIEDAVAMVKFAYYLKSQFGRAELTEISLADKLESLRRQGEHFVDLSFSTICGYNEHGAIVHYSATPQTDVAIKRKGVLLVDSGAQYLYGTTDITRTYILGNARPKLMMDYTLVLKAHIALAKAVFPKGTCGMVLDMLAREPLYRNFCDFNHGTGHGVGCLLNVHEGPASISVRSRGSAGLQPFLPGMIVSDEPGLYLSGKYGIRLENLLLCVELGKSEYGTFCGFEPLTMVPFDLEAVDVTMLDDEERRWLNNYHRTVYGKISPYLSGEELDYLARATRGI